ncbi:hypothetical protein [Pseudomonas syringae group genomosp. 7]|uniref:hypothetical protein n=1 Tax=Pseudomonas syringae group genomosp. 7 TaxID=251699 RepID=UPI0037704749
MVWLVWGGVWLVVCWGLMIWWGLVWEWWLGRSGCVAWWLWVCWLWCVCGVFCWGWCVCCGVFGVFGVFLLLFFCFSGVAFGFCVGLLGVGVGVVGLWVVVGLGVVGFCCFLCAVVFFLGGWGFS